MITKSELRTLTLWHHATLIGKLIPGMETFPAYYKASLKGPAARLVERFDADKADAAAELEKMMEEDQPPATPAH